MATIERRSDGRDGICVRWRTLDGRSRRRKVTSERNAIRLAAEIDRCHERGIEWEPARVSPQPTGVAEVIEQYISHRRLRVALATVTADAAHLEVIARFFAARRITLLRELSRPLLDDLLAWLLRPKAALHGGQRKAVSANRTAGVALALWRWADDSGRYHDAPRCPREIDLAPTVDAPVVAPTWAEMDACVAATRGWLRRLVTWLRYTGLRVGESMLMEWRDVDMAGGAVTIRPEIDKMRRGRVIPLHPALLDEIATWGKREGYLIDKGGDGYRRDTPGRGMGRAWRRAGVREEVWRRRPDHAFRKGFKSGLRAMGADADAIDYLQGHSLGAGARGRYIDGSMLPLAETLAMVPVIGGAAVGNVVKLGVKR